MMNSIYAVETQEKDGGKWYSGPRLWVLATTPQRAIKKVERQALRVLSVELKGTVDVE